MVSSRSKTAVAAIVLITIMSVSSILIYFRFKSPSPTETSPLRGVYDQLDLSPYNWRMVEHGKVYNLTQYYSGLPRTVLVMDLNGTYAQMGYAHGQLVGPLIKYAVESSYYTLTGDNMTLYEGYHNHFVPSNLTMNSVYHAEEVKAIRQACVDNGYDMFVPVLNRAWDEVDLWLLNAGYEVNRFPTQSCSGFGVWGSDALAGQTLVGRNFDFQQDPAGYITQLNLIIIYRGNGSRNDIISFGYPGSVGIISAFNDKGVWLASDNSNGGWNHTNNRNFLQIAGRNFLEHQNNSHVAENAVQFFTKVNSLAPFLYMVGSDMSSANPAFVLEGNDSMVVARTALSGQEYVYVTNHQRILWPLPSHTELHWQTFTWEFGNLTTNPDYVVSPDEGRQMLVDVEFASVSCFLFYPSTLQFSVGYGWINAQDGETWHKNDFKPGQGNPLFNCTIDYHDL